MAARTRPRLTRGACCPLPGVFDGRVRLDWSDHKVSPRPRRCRICADGAYMTDCAGTPCHKACAELEATRILTDRTATYAQTGA